MRNRFFLISVLFFSCNIIIAQDPKLILPIGHALGVSTAVISPDGKRMVTSSLDNAVKIWDIPSGMLLANLRGHTDTVVSANYSPDGKLIVTSCQDGTAKIWDAVTTVLLKDFKGHSTGVYVAEFSPDGKKIVTASDDGMVKLWDVNSGKLIADLKGHSKAVWWAWFSPDGKKIVTSSEDSTAKIWDVVTGKMLLDLRGHTFEILSVEFSPDGKKVITGSGDSTAKIWDAISGILLRDIKEHKGPVRFTHFSPDGKRFVTASDDGDVKLWNVETGALIANIKGKPVFKIEEGSYYPDIVRAADFSPDGKKLLTIYRDSATKIWDAFTGKLLLNLNRGDEFVNSASFSKDGKKISLALAYAHVEIYDVAKGNLLTDLKGSANYIQGFALSPDGKRILVSNWYGSAKLIDANTGTQVATFPSSNNSERGVYARYSPDGKKIVTVTDDNFARVWDAVTGIQLFELKGHKKIVYGAAFSPDGKKILTSSADSTKKIWDAFTGKLLTDIKHGQVGVNFAMSPDGKKFLTAPLSDSIIKIWSETGKVLAELKGHTKSVMLTSFSFDGRKILTYSRDSTAKIWDTETGTLLINIKQPFNHIRWAMFSPDGKKIILTTYHSKKKNAATQIWDAESGVLITELPKLIQYLTYQLSPDGEKITSGTNEGSIVTMDLETGKLLSEIKAHTGPVFRIAFSPDRKKIVSGSEEGEVKIWDAETGALLKILSEHTFTIQSADFSPDGKKIYTVSNDHTAKVWDTETGTSLYTYVAVGKDDYLFLDKYNHFDGTEAARKLLYFTCGTEVIELEQVKDQLWVPNLAERILTGETINAAKLSDLNICNLTPLVDTIEQTALQYRFQITPRLGGLGASIVYVNGIEVKRHTPQQLMKQKEGYQLAIDKKELQKFFVTNKENTITVKALTAKNTISSRSVSINERGNEKSTALPNLYAVVVGVSDYKGEALDLKFAAKDAVDMSNALDISAKKLLNTDDKEHVFIYKIHTGAGRDKFPEKNSIRQVFAEIAGKAQPNDILLIFFAGHGVMETEKNQFYFLTADASSATVTGALKDVGISTEEISDWIKPQVMKAQKRILIFDACNSGQVIKEMISIGQKGQNFLASRGDEKGKQVKAIEKLNERSGMFILSASASDQKAYEMGKYNQGTLTYSLLRAIKEEPDILEDRKYLNISRWFNAAEKSVGELARETGSSQQPQVVSTTNFNIGVVDEDVRNMIILPFEKPMLTRSDFRNVDSRIDNLKLRSMVDKELDEISGNRAGASIMYSTEYDGANIYAISGDYTVTGSDAAVSVILTKGGTDIKTKFEVKGMANQPEIMAKSIVNTVTEWLKNNKE